MSDALERLDRRMSRLAVSVARKLAEKIEDPESVSGSYLSAGRLFLSNMGRLREVKGRIADGHQSQMNWEETARRDAPLPSFGGEADKVRLR